MSFGLLLAAMAATAPSEAVPAAEAARVAFEEGLADRDWEKTSTALNALIEARLPSDGRLAVDPVLADTSGRLGLARGASYWALALLKTVPKDALSGEARGRHALALARAYLLTGDYDAAAREFAPLISGAGAPHAQARLGQARALLAVDPARSLEALASLSGPSSPREIMWEAALIGAAAHSLRGDAQAARTSAEKAWAIAPLLPARYDAPRQAAAMLAAVGVADFGVSAALTDLAKGSIDADDIKQITRLWARRLPTCGDGGVVPEDYVQVVIGQDVATAATHVTPVRASRPGIVAAFLAGLDGASILDAEQRGRGLISVLIRCRTKPAPQRGQIGGEQLFAQWTASNGLYLPVATAEPGDADELRRREERLAARQERFGPDSPQLFPVLMMASEAILARAKLAGDVPVTRAPQLAARAAALARKIAGGAAIYASPTGAEFELALLERDPGDAAAMARFTAEIGRDWFKAAHPVLVFEGAQSIMDNENIPPTQRTTQLGHALAGMNGRTQGYEDRMRWLQGMQAIYLFQEGREAEARALVRTSGYAADLCEMRQTPPEVEDAPVLPDDYPTHALEAMLEGRDTIEFDADANGRVTRMRPLVEAPANVFTGIAVGKIAQFRLTPARERGRPVACRAMLRTIQWKIPARETPDLDSFTPSVPPGT